MSYVGGNRKDFMLPDLRRPCDDAFDAVPPPSSSSSSASSALPAQPTLLSCLRSYPTSYLNIQAELTNPAIGPFNAAQMHQ